VVADGDKGRPGAGRVVYAGRGPWEGTEVMWHMERSWDDVLTQAGEHVARVVSALASATRLRIAGELVSGPVTTGDLAARLDQPSSGQLFHHLKELLAVGVVHQPRRGTYALRPQHVLPVLALLSAKRGVSYGPYDVHTAGGTRGATAVCVSWRRCRRRSRSRGYRPPT
jgi:DNA-binding transcriptional ArsR family regulator